MVRCTRCGTGNEESAKFCVNCGVTLYSEETKKKRGDNCFGENQAEDECFGLPHSGSIVGIIFGMIIILLGLAMLLGQNIGRLIGPFVAIIIGILIVAGAIYRLTRKR